MSSDYTRDADKCRTGDEERLQAEDPAMEVGRVVITEYIEPDGTMSIGFWYSDNLGKFHILTLLEQAKDMTNAITLPMADNSSFQDMTKPDEEDENDE